MSRTIKRITVDIEIEHNPGDDLDKMLNDMEYSFESNTKGIEIISANIIDIDTIFPRKY